MKYRQCGKTAMNASVLGFGCMRLPVLEGDSSRVDVPEAVRMIRRAVDEGVNYIDTAYGYHGGQSERVVGQALRDGYRDKVYLATKFPPWHLKKPSDFDRYLDEQLGKLGTDHVDVYLMHALDKNWWNVLLKNGVFDALEKYKKSGRIKYAGFSFHDDADTFRRIIDAYDWDICQIQYNYMDENTQAGLSGLMYAAQRSIAVVAMEPLLGGKLAVRPPEPVARLWDAAVPKRTPAEWALLWLWNHPEISVVLSGMSTFGQVEENLRTAEAARAGALTPGELELFERVKAAYRAIPQIACTGCEYCMPCPHGVRIPVNFSRYNELRMFNDRRMKEAYWKMDEAERAANCRECGKCMKVCPQKLPIPELMKQVASEMAER